MSEMRPSSPESPGGDGVVVHLDEDTPGKHEAVLRNISHLLDELDDQSPVELVAHGPGIGALLHGSPHSAMVQDLHGRGVLLVACGNTMKRMGIDVDELADGVRIAPSGLGQLVIRQREGWAYVRP